MSCYWGIAKKQRNLRRTSRRLIFVGYQGKGFYSNLLFTHQFAVFIIAVRFPNGIGLNVYELGAVFPAGIFIGVVAAPLG